MARIAVSTAADEPLLGHLLYVAQTIAREQGLHETGFRLVINNGRDGGESVAHLHVHLLGGRGMGWPPG
jgi:histidine triad (HIT) family protein